MKQRIISAIVALAIVIPLFLLGGIPFSIGVGIVAALAYAETLNLNKSHKIYPVYIKCLGFLCLELIVYSHMNGSLIYSGVGYLPVALSCLVFTIPTIFDTKDKYTTKESFYLLGTLLLIGCFFNTLCIINLSNKWLLLYLILIAILTDTFAMLIGCLIGKHKLIPKVSPKKTIEGSVAGSLVGTIVATIYYMNIVDKSANLIIILLITLILSVLGQLGDLYFSKIKRENEIKDFSNIMPGHGGILDRLDSLSFIVLGFVVIVNILNFF